MFRDLDQNLFVKEGELKPEETEQVFRLWSMNPENGKETETLFVLEKPEKEGPYRRDWLEKVWKEGPLRPSLSPPLREELTAFSEMLRMKLGRPFVCQIVRTGGAFKLMWIEEADDPDASCFPQLLRAVRGTGLRTGSPFKTSLYTALRRQGLRRFLNETALLKEKDMKEPLSARLYGRAYENISVAEAVLRKLPSYTREGFAEFYGLKTADCAAGRRSIPPFSFFYELKFYLAGRLAADSYDSGSKERRSGKEEMLALYEQALLEELPEQKLCVMWYQLSHAEFADVQGRLAAEEIILAGEYLRFRRRCGADPARLPVLGEHEEIKRFSALWKISRMLRKEQEDRQEKEKTSRPGAPSGGKSGDRSPAQFDSDSAEAKLAEYFPQTIHDRRYRKKLLRDLDFLLTAEGDEEEVCGHWPARRLPSASEKLTKTLARREALLARSQRLYLLLLRYCDRLGEQLLKDGVLTEARDWRFLQFEEISAYIKQDCDAATLREFAEKNRSYYFSGRHYMSPHILGCPPPKQELKGCAASPGKAEGRLCVCRSFKDLQKFRPGDILVCRLTDIAWSCHLLLASALVTTEGGIMSHPAVLAREGGKPCIVSLRMPLDAIKDGARAEVDGSSGTLRYLDEESDAEKSDNEESDGEK